MAMCYGTCFFIIERSDRMIDKEERVPNAETIKAIEDAENNHNIHGPYNSVKDLMEDLLKDD